MTKRFGFLSHSSSDKGFAEKLAHKLNENGLDVFFDKWEIKVGDSIVDKIDSAMGEMTDLIIILSKKSVNSKWVKKELSSAVMKKLKNKSVKILPVLLEECKIPDIISDLRYADFTKSFESGFIDLMEALGLTQRNSSEITLVSKNEIEVKKVGQLVPLIRYTPILPSTLKKSDSTWAQMASIITDTLLIMTGNGLLYCGKCKSPITLQKAEPKPLVCPQCGEAINWVGILTKEEKQCPVCKRKFLMTTNFCPYHFPAVPLITNEIDLELWKS